MRRRQFLVGAGTVGLGLSGIVGQASATPPEDKIQWSSKPANGNYFATAPTVVDKTVYVSGYSGLVYAFNTESGDVRWKAELGGRPSTPATVVDGTVYVGSEDGRLYALSANGGSEQWTYGTRGAITNSPIIGNDAIYIGSKDGNTYRLDRKTRKRLNVFDKGLSKPRIGPLVANGQLYIRSAERLLRIDVETSEITWEFGGVKAESSDITVADKTVYFGEDGTVFALNATDGTEQWRFKTGKDIKSGPTVADGTAFIETSSNSFHAINTTNGTERWSFKTGSEIRAQPTIAGKTVFVHTINGYLYALDSKTGKQRWMLRTTEPWERSVRPVTEPIVANGTVYASTMDVIHAIDVDSAGFSRGSRAQQALYGHHGGYTGGPVPTTGFGEPVSPPAEPTNAQTQTSTPTGEATSEPTDSD